MGANDKFIVHFSEGRGTNLGKAKNRTAGWAQFRKMFEKPTRTKETFKHYSKLGHDEQVRLKSVDGWLYRTHVEKGVRNAHSGKPSDLWSLDCDSATPELVDRIEMGLVAHRFEYLVHSSRRHTEEKPRIRFWGIFSRPVDNEEYSAISRIIASIVDPSMESVDKVSFRPAQMMFKPTASKDGDWFYHHNEGDPVDPDQLFADFEERVGDWHDLNNLPRCPGEELREHAEKAEDPTQKPGPVGDFCRAYDVQDAIEKFDLPYDPVDDHSAKPRYSYRFGSTTNGAVVEDDGLFLYSHHGSDPCADMLVNAFDLVRIHKFGKQDEKEDPDTPITKWPSYKAMLEFIQEDPAYKRQQARSKYDQQAMFDDVMDEYFSEHPEDDEEEEDEDDEDLVGDPNEARRKYEAGAQGKSESGAAFAASNTRKTKKRKPPKDWFPDELELDKAGNIVQNLPNAQVIIHNDPRLFDAIAYDDFMKRVVLRRDVVSGMESVPPAYCSDKSRGDIWQDFHDMTVRSILAAPNGAGKRGYGLDKLAERDLATAIYTTSRRNTFHPIKDYLDFCHTALGWDGEERVSRLFIDYLGCPDTPYHRQAATMTMVASVARIFEPGHKFDFSPVLQGKGGIRKSSFIEALYGAEYFGELDCNLRDTQQIAETIGGSWALEFPELTSFYRSDYNDAKRFLSAKQDKVRMAYDRRVSVFPRQATFWGTTNDKQYLKDPTGNRRWWPIIVMVPMIDTDLLKEHRDQLWAEAMTLYLAMREKQPRGDLPLYLSDPKARIEADALQTEARTRVLFEIWAERIQDWADTPITLQQFRSEYGLNERMPDENEPDPDKIMVLRCVMSAADAQEHALDIDRVIKNDQMTQNVQKALAHIEGWQRERGYKDPPVRRLGKQARWLIRSDATAKEIAFGYRVVEEEEESLV